ncbi:uncharacterized protein (DUF1330 family) [Inhella inkyongensis]|uniref:Uncharacterized protein (DUF1330 family) n=1 Tax=Inhella inkyongensis TaxID=392593 RepID=A0A840S4W8_9BURK|nr:DUF1330 domain-containing protein [Inhella inkyongensis]MBB5204076.1 uncharacterized protein (DUF1330 family) [Inhella inkyongensis]
MSTPAYALITVKIVDPEIFKAYMAAAPATIAACGGEYLVRGGAFETVEGEWNPARITVLRFPSMEQARAWYFGEGYTQARALRQSATEYFNVTLVEGYAPA